MNGRRILLALVLAATLAASWWALNLDDDDAALVLPVEQRSTGAYVAARKPAAAAAGSTSNRLERLSAQRPAWPELSVGLAQVVRFTPPASAAPVVRVEPQAPPLPFRYVGAIDDAQGKAVFLVEGTQVRMARAGEEIGGQYRLVRITPTAIEFTYLPLNKTQFLNRQNP